MAIAKQKSKTQKKESLNKLKKLSSKFPFLKEHLMSFKEKKDTLPTFIEDKSDIDSSETNIIYKVDKNTFAHINTPGDDISRYYAIEPKLRENEKELYSKIKKDVVLRSSDYSSMETEEEYKKELKKILEDITKIENTKNPKKKKGISIGILSKNNKKKYEMSQKTFNRIFYALKKEIVGLGPIEPLSKDKLNEDIHILGYDKVNANHKVFDMVRTNIDLGSEEEYIDWLETMAERVGSPISSKNPIIDSTLPDGSRLNIVYSEDVSVEGPTVTIRQFEEEPLSIFKIVNYGTMNPELAAYLWLCLESNVSMAVSGETAAGKTTTLNALTQFIPRDKKIYTAEDSLEVRPPHDAWQRLLTRKGIGEKSGVDLFNLVKNALRSRPGYIIVGEVRGKEGFNVFQAMQTGHPTIFTFHSGTVTSLIDRFTSEPINVPEKFFDNLNLIIFQNFIRKGNKEMRRVTSVFEIEGYSKDADGIVTRKAFEYDLESDRIDFIGRNNSFILEEDVANTMGLTDSREVYSLLDERKKVIKKAVDEGYYGWDESTSIIRTFQEEGGDELPFVY